MTSGSRASTPTPQDAHVSGLAAQLCTNLALSNVVRKEIWYSFPGLMTTACGLAERNCFYLLSAAWKPVGIPGDAASARGRLVQRGELLAATPQPFIYLAPNQGHAVN